MLYGRLRFLCMHVCMYACLCVIIQEVLITDDWWIDPFHKREWRYSAMFSTKIKHMHLTRNDQILSNLHLKHTRRVPLENAGAVLQVMPWEQALTIGPNLLLRPDVAGDSGIREFVTRSTASIHEIPKSKQNKKLLNLSKLKRFLSMFISLHLPVSLSWLQRSC